MSQELYEASRRLRDSAKVGFRDLPGGSVSAYLNTLSKEVRVALATQYKGLEHAVESGGRLAPFQPKLTEDELTAGQPKELRDTISKLQTEIVAQGLDQRMATSERSAAIQQEQPTTLRDVALAAYDAHSQE